MVTDYFEDRADVQLQVQLDENNYNESELISIKVPASLPYGVSSKKFERVDGEVDVKGVTYTYVKRRFYNDTLELLCIPNTVKTGIINARDEFFRLANDFVNSSSAKKETGHHATHTVKFSIQDYANDHSFVWQYPSFESSQKYHDQQFAVNSFLYLNQQDKPPQA